MLLKPCIGERPGVLGYINGLFVIPRYRRAGWGQRLVDRGNDWFREQGVTLIELYTTIGNDSAERFWKRNHFHPYETVMLSRLMPSSK